MATLQDLKAALRQKSGFEVVEETESKNQLRLVGRQPRDEMGVNVKNWLCVVRMLLQASKSDNWQVDVSKWHFLRGTHVVYGWRLIFQGEKIDQRYQSIIQAVNGAPHVSRGELTEYPLNASKDRNTSPTGKGATFMNDRNPFSPRGAG